MGRESYRPMRGDGVEAGQATASVRVTHAAATSATAFRRSWQNSHPSSWYLRLTPTLGSQRKGIATLLEVGQQLSSEHVPAQESRGRYRARGEPYAWRHE